MKSTGFLLAAFVTVAMTGRLSPARADSNEAMCEVRIDGEVKHGLSGPCTFSQRQGYVDLHLQNGETYSLSPGGKSNHFKDQKGHNVARTQAGGNTQEFKWEGGRRVILTFGGSAAASDGGAGIALADMPRYCQGMWEVWGQYPAQPSPQVFICSFNSERQFLSVDKYQP